MFDSLSNKLTYGYGSSKTYHDYSAIFNKLQNEKYGVYFCLSELLYSETAIRKSLKNEPNEYQFRNLCRLLQEILYPVRIATGVPIHINSGFRSSALNIAVGGVHSSHHTEGLAADIWCCDMLNLWRNLEALPHRELIQYKNFIHVAL